MSQVPQETASQVMHAMTEQHAEDNSQALTSSNEHPVSLAVAS